MLERRKKRGASTTAVSPLDSACHIFLSKTQRLKASSSSISDRRRERRFLNSLFISEQTAVSALFAPRASHSTGLTLDAGLFAMGIGISTIISHRTAHVYPHSNHARHVSDCGFTWFRFGSGPDKHKHKQTQVRESGDSHSGWTRGMWQE